jgi:hypothetical protein
MVIFCCFFLFVLKRLRFCLGYNAFRSLHLSGLSSVERGMVQGLAHVIPTSTSSHKRHYILLSLLCFCQVALLVITHKLRLHKSGLLNECALQILRYAQDDSQGFVILSVAKDLLQTSGESPSLVKDYCQSID